MIQVAIIWWWQSSTQTTTHTNFLFTKSVSFCRKNIYSNVVFVCMLYFLFLLLFLFCSWFLVLRRLIHFFCSYSNAMFVSVTWREGVLACRLSEKYVGLSEKWKITLNEKFYQQMIVHGEHWVSILLRFRVFSSTWKRFGLFKNVCFFVTQRIHLRKVFFWCITNRRILVLYYFQPSNILTFNRTEHFK